jgi:hypothetical protein
MDTRAEHARRPRARPGELCAAASVAPAMPMLPPAIPAGVSPAVPTPLVDHGGVARRRAAPPLRARSAAAEVSASLPRRLDAYRAARPYLTSLVLKRQPAVAFIGSIGIGIGIGIGKSTAMCRMTGLEGHDDGAPVQPVLEAGAGGLPVGEVPLYTGPQDGNVVAACPDEDIRQHVTDFADPLSRAGNPAGAGETESGGSERPGLSRELERAVRNTSGLRV